jgi:hypothetical protein
MDRPCHSVAPYGAGWRHCTGKGADKTGGASRYEATPVLPTPGHCTYKDPLLLPEHFARYIGQVATVTLRMAVNNRRKYKGTIKQVEREMITLTIDGKDEILAFANIQQANLIPNFD